MRKNLSASEWRVLCEALGLQTDQLAEIKRHSARISVEVHTNVVFEVGDPSIKLFILLPDSARLLNHATLSLAPFPGAEPVTIELISEGVVGDEEYLARTQNDVFPERQLSCNVSSETRLATIPYIVLLCLPATLRQHIERHLAQVAFRRRQLVSQKLAVSRVSGAEAQLAYTVARIAEELGSRQGSGYSLPSILNQSTIAKDVGLTRESVSSIMAEWERSGITETLANSLVIKDMERLKRLMELQAAPSQANVSRTVSQVDRLISRGEYVRARNMCIDAIKALPGHPLFHHRGFVAAMRAGTTLDAKRFIEPFGSAIKNGEAALKRVLKDGLTDLRRRRGTARANDTEDQFEENLTAADNADRKRRVLEANVSHLAAQMTAAHGRLIKDQALETANRDERSARSSEAAELYHQAYKMQPDTYSCINTASLLLCAGRIDEARHMAQEVIRLSSRRTDYWSTAARAEALIVLGKNEEARKQYQKAFQASDCTPGNLSTTRAQLRSLERLLQITAGELSNLAPQYSICCYSGHLPPLGRKRSRQANVEPDLLRLFKALSTIAGFGACAAGGDIVISRSLINAGADLHLLLPGPLSEFQEQSVTPYGYDWSNEVTTTIIPASRSLRTMSLDRLSRLHPDEMEERLWFANRQSIGLSKLLAQTLQAKPFAVTLYDGRPTTSVAGTAMFIHDAESAGLHVERFLWPTLPRTSGSRSGREQATPRFHRCVVFMRSEGPHARNRHSQIAEEARAAIGSMGSVEFEITQNDRVANKASTAYVFRSISGALSFAAAVCHVLPSKDTATSVICDFGTVLNRDGLLDLSGVKRLGAADSQLTAPVGALSCTEAFAAEAMSDRMPYYEFAPSGRAASGTGASMLKPTISLYSAKKRADGL